ncbi:MAG: hypothetical protein H6650_20995 [Ardenticatenales bacterium]|nr:hypothetical protein [Ardenticatenales bacterium]
MRSKVLFLSVTMMVVILILFAYPDDGAVRGIARQASSRSLIGIRDRRQTQKAFWAFVAPRRQRANDNHFGFVQN